MVTPDDEHDEHDEHDAPVEGAVEDTVVRPRTLAAAAEAGAESNGPDVEDTIIRLIEPHAPARERVESSPRADPDALVTPQNLPAPLASAEASRAAWAAHVRGTEVTIALDRPLIVGRNPRETRVEETPPPRRVRIPAQHRDVSSRHARVEQVGDTLVVTDLGSTNGIDVHWSTGLLSRLRPGETSVVLPDAVIALGDAVVIEFVVAPST